MYFNKDNNGIVFACWSKNFTPDSKIGETFLVDIISVCVCFKREGCQFLVNHCLVLVYLARSGLTLCDGRIVVYIYTQANNL